MTIDTSIITGATQVNPVQALSQGLAVKGQMLQQSQLQQQIASNQAASGAYKAATDPNTGQVDYNKLTAILSQGPAAYNLPAIQGQITDQQNKQLELQKNTYDLAVKRTQHLQNGLGILMANPNATQQDYINLGAQAVKDGTATPSQTVQYLQQMPSDPAQLQAWGKQKWLQSLDDDAQLKALLPQTQTVNTGATTQFIKTDPITGNPTLAGNLQNTMSPGDAATPTAVFDPSTNTMRDVTKQQFSGLANGVPQAGISAPSPQPSGNGRYPTQNGGQPLPAMGQGASMPFAAPPASPVSNQQQMAAPGPVGVQTAPALGAQEAANVTAQGAATSALNLQHAADAAPQSIYQLQNMRSALGDISTGPNADWLGKAKALALQVSPGLAQSIGVDPQNVASQEEFKKFATQLAQGSASALGEGTDTKLASAVAANPNTALSSLGNQQIINVLIATQRANQAKNMAWQNSGMQPQDFNKFSSQWNEQVDPRIFVGPEMSAQERFAMRNSLSAKDKLSFDNSYNAAVQSGLIQRPSN